MLGSYVADCVPFPVFLLKLSSFKFNILYLYSFFLNLNYFEDVIPVSGDSHQRKGKDFKLLRLI